MRKTIYMFTLALFTVGVALSCREEKTTGEKVEDGVEEVGEGLEDATDDVEDAVEDATDDN